MTEAAAIKSSSFQEDLLQDVILDVLLLLGDDWRREFLSAEEVVAVM